MQRGRRQPEPVQAKPGIPQEEKEALQGLLTTEGWRSLERMLSEEINIAIAANLRVGAEHDYFIGVVDGLSVVFDILSRATEKPQLTKQTLVKKLDPATSGWLKQFRALCKHPAEEMVDNPALGHKEYTCRSCGKKRVEEYDISIT